MQKFLFIDHLLMNNFDDSADLKFTNKAKKGIENLSNLFY